MITETSVLYMETTCNAEINDKRAHVLIGLLQSRMSIEDIAEALNCKDTVVRSLLVAPYHNAYTGLAAGPVALPEPIDLENFPPTEPTVVERSGSGTQQEPVRQVERLAHFLLQEVCHWLTTFEASDAARQKAVERAGILLDESSFYWQGKYDYQCERISMEVVGAWRPTILVPENREFRMLMGNWLASWIHFWIADPDVWNRALDFAFDYFGAKAQAAA